MSAQPDFGGQVNTTVYMAELAVSPVARGLGLGARLVDARLEWANRNGLDWFVMRTDPHQSVSARIYQRRGARAMATLQDLGTAMDSHSRTRRFWWGPTLRAPTR